MFEDDEVSSEEAVMLAEILDEFNTAEASRAELVDAIIASERLYSWTTRQLAAARAELARRQRAAEIAEHARRQRGAEIAALNHDRHATASVERARRRRKAASLARRRRRR